MSIQNYDLVVAITAWNMRSYVQKCLDSIFSYEHPGLNFKVVLLDDASTDGLAEFVRGNYPQVEVLQSKENSGFARANNVILRKYQDHARYFLLLNADTIIQEDTFTTMVEFMDDHPRAGIAGCKVMRADGVLDYPCKRSFQTPEVFFYRALGLDARFPKHPKFGRYHLTYLDENKTHEVDAVVGAFLMIRRETMAQVGFLDENLYMYSEDMEWCHRVKQNGWQIFYHPKTKILHYKSVATRRRPFRNIYWWYYSTWYVYRKHMAQKYNMLVNTFVRIGFFVMCGISLVTNLFKAQRAIPSRR